MNEFEEKWRIPEKRKQFQQKTDEVERKMIAYMNELEKNEKKIPSYLKWNNRRTTYPKLSLKYVIENPEKFDKKTLKQAKKLVKKVWKLKKTSNWITGYFMVGRGSTRNFYRCLIRFDGHGEWTEWSCGRSFDKNKNWAEHSLFKLDQKPCDVFL